MRRLTPLLLAGSDRAELLALTVLHCGHSKARISCSTIGDALMRFRLTLHRMQWGAASIDEPLKWGLILGTFDVSHREKPILRSPRLYGSFPLGCLTGRATVHL